MNLWICEAKEEVCGQKTFRKWVVFRLGLFEDDSIFPTNNTVNYNLSYDVEGSDIGWFMINEDGICMMMILI